MSEYRTISIPVAQATDEIITMMLNSKFSDSDLAGITRSVKDSRLNYEQREGHPHPDPMPTTPLELMKAFCRNSDILFFSGESYADDHMQEDICLELQKRGISYRYHMDHEEHDNDITLWTPQGCVQYDVNCDGEPILPYKAIVDSLDLPTDTDTIAEIKAILSKYSPWRLPSLESHTKKKVEQEHAIDEILARFDAGHITQAEAFKEIADYKAKNGTSNTASPKLPNVPLEPLYLVFVDSEFCDAQAIVTHPDGEMGGDHYVELHRTYPIYIGSYRGESEAEAIEAAAKDFGCDEGVLYATQV